MERIRIVRPTWYNLLRRHNLWYNNRRYSNDIGASNCKKSPHIIIFLIASIDPPAGRLVQLIRAYSYSHKEISFAVPSNNLFGNFREHIPVKKYRSHLINSHFICFCCCSFLSCLFTHFPRFVFQIEKKWKNGSMNEWRRTIGL